MSARRASQSCIWMGQPEQTTDGTGHVPNQGESKQKLAKISLLATVSVFLTGKDHPLH